MTDQTTPVNTRSRRFREARRAAQDAILCVVSQHKEKVLNESHAQSFEAMATQYEMLRLLHFYGFKSVEGNVEATFQRVMRERQA